MFHVRIHTQLSLYHREHMLTSLWPPATTILSCTSQQNATNTSSVAVWSSLVLLKNCSWTFTPVTLVTPWIQWLFLKFILSVSRSLFFKSFLHGFRTWKSLGFIFNFFGVYFSVSFFYISFSSVFPHFPNSFTLGTHRTPSSQPYFKLNTSHCQSHPA